MAMDQSLPIPSFWVVKIHLVVTLIYSTDSPNDSRIPSTCSHVFRASNPAACCAATSEFNLSNASAKEVRSIRSPNMAMGATG